MLLQPTSLIRRICRACRSLPLALVLTSSVLAQPQLEQLDRGLVALRQGDGSVFLSWRLLGTEPADTAFHIFRAVGSGQAEQLTAEPLTQGTWFVDTRPVGGAEVRYEVRSADGRQRAGAFTLRGNVPQPYLSIPLQTPADYTPGDASVGDLDGDGQYEVVLKQEKMPRDNAHAGVTAETILQAYKLDGKLLWQINLGKNIREGAHYTQFLVYDLDGDGRAEVACKTADGTIDGRGKVIGDAQADHRNQQGHILRGPEFLTIFDGLTGGELSTVPYIPARHPSKLEPTTEELREIWGDGRGNRSDRYLACVAYLDGQRPSLVMCRGYYTRSVLAAWNWRDGKLTHVWTFDSDDGTAENRAFRGQGNHNLSVADVDGDGRDEIVYGAAVIDDNGKGLYSTGLGHGDALHVSDLDPQRPGLEIFNIQERFGDAGANFRDAKTGEILWKKPSVKADAEGGDRGEGPGRANAINIDPRHPGHECWVAGSGGIEQLFNAKGEPISDQKPRSCNFAVWWDGDLLRELLDRNTVYKWRWQSSELTPLLVAENCSSNNGTKATPALSGDILGDWREEVMLRTQDGKELRIFVSTVPTQYRMPTLMHDAQYRLAIAWQNVAYNQPPHPSFYLDDAAPLPVRKLVKTASRSN
jgi:rhamnogalacturonan endolyase